MKQVQINWLIHSAPKSCTSWFMVLLFELMHSFYVAACELVASVKPKLYSVPACLRLEVTK